LRALEDKFGDDPNQPQCNYTIKNPERVLVRLKVEHTGFTKFIDQRFGSQFVGQVVSGFNVDFVIVLFSSLSSIQALADHTLTPFPIHPMLRM
jgi:hypothetical protein